MESTGSSRDGTRRRAKIGHRKSRNGCRVCKGRRVKCDENHPVCASCARLNLDCTWPEQSVRPPTIVSPPGTLPRIGLGPVQPAANGTLTTEEKSGPAAGEALLPLFDSSDEIVLPESRARRMLEHRLMQHYILNMTKPFPLSPGPAWSDIFRRRIPQMALEYDNLLFILLANAANNLRRREPDNVELATAAQSYFISAIREQREMVSKLSTANADAVCLASILLLVHSWACLQDRPLEPYSPPTQWIQMGRGSGALIWMSVAAVMTHGTEEEKAQSCLVTISKDYPRFAGDMAQSFFAPELRRVFQGVLTQKLPGSGDTWDDGTREAYEETLSYVGSIQAAIDHGEPVYAVYRRIQSFALLVPSRFIEFVEEQRPRALVIIAHFFATVAQLPSTWWIGDGEGGRELTVHREIRAISKALPPEWAGQLVWPLDILGGDGRGCHEAEVAGSSCPPLL